MALKSFQCFLLSAAALAFLFIAGCEDDAALKASSITKKTEPTTQNSLTYSVELAYHSLSDEEKQEIAGDWKNAAVSKTVASTRHFGLSDPLFEGKEVTKVTFVSKRKALLGDIIKLVDEQSGNIVGSGFRD